MDYYIPVVAEAYKYFEQQNEQYFIDEIQKRKDKVEKKLSEIRQEKQGRMQQEIDRFELFLIIKGYESYINDDSVKEPYLNYSNRQLELYRDHLLMIIKDQTNVGDEYACHGWNSFNSLHNETTIV